MHKWLLVAATTLLMAPPAFAGTPDAPELTDSRNDPAPSNGPPLPVPWAPALDLEAVWFTDDDEGLHAHMRLADLGALELAEPSPSDFMWIAIWSPGYQEPSGAAARQGTWELRAEYRPLDDPAWHYWLERPCLDGDDSDGCAGPDRDIVDGLPGSVDVASSTITITAPWRHLAHPRSGDGIQGLWATAQADHPGHPVRWVDWDIDEGDQCYLFSHAPTSPAGFNGTDPGATGSSNGRTGFPQPYPAFDSCAEHRASGPPAQEAATVSHDDEATATTTTITTTSPAEEPPALDTKDSPGAGVLVLPVLLGAAFRRRVRRAAT